MPKLNVLVVVQKQDKDAVITIICDGVVSPLITIRDIGFVSGNPYLLYGSYVGAWLETRPESINKEVCIQVAQMTSGDMNDYSTFWGS